MRNKLTRRKVSSVKRIVSQKDCATKLFSSRNCFPLSASSGGWNCAMQFTNIRIREEIRLAKVWVLNIGGKKVWYWTKQEFFFSMQPKSNLWVTSRNDFGSGSKIKKNWENCFQNILYFVIFNKSWRFKSTSTWDLVWGVWKFERQKSKCCFYCSIGRTKRKITFTLQSKKS